MEELRANLWTVEADCRVITTNGFVKRNGEAVMGRGCALEAAQKWPDLPALLGGAIRRNGNVTTYLCGPDHDAGNLISLPVKHHWQEPADLALIVRSVVKLVELVNWWGWRRVVLPRPGCGNGKLCWEMYTDRCLGPVKPAIAPLLDDRFTVVYL